MPISLSDRTAIDRAITLARDCTNGNRESRPKVGTVITGENGDMALSPPAISPPVHAEFLALLAMLERGITGPKATLYTTLEPCEYCQHSYGGRDISCVELISELRIGRVVIGSLHPRPNLRGRAVELLLKHGIEVDFFPRDARDAVQVMYEKFLATQIPSTRRTRAAVVVSAYAVPFQKSVLHALLLRLGGSNIDGVVRTPQELRKREVRYQRIDGVLVPGHEFHNALILTNNLQLSRTELIDFVEQFDRPIVFVDADPAPTVSELPEGVTLVAYHNRKGARLAARHIAKTIATHPNPRVLVLGAELQSTRHETFVKELRKQGREIRCDVEIAHFSRKEAYSAAKMRLRSAHDEESPYQAVFATSDDMALGVVDAIQQLELAEKPLVGAYDGGEEVMTHLHRPDSALQFTIVQETTRLVEEVVKMLEHPANRPRGGRRFLDPGIKEGVRPR